MENTKKSSNVTHTLCARTLRMIRIDAVFRLAVMLYVSVALVGSAPVRSSVDPLPRWLRPCLGNNPVTQAPGESIALPTDPTPPHEHLNRIVRAASDARTEIQTLMNRYVTERFGDPNFPTYLEEISLNNMPKVEQKRVVDPVNIQVEESLEVTYDNLAKVAVFLEVVRKDEILKQMSTFASHFVREIQDIEEKHIYTLLCYLEGALRAHGRDVTSDVTTEIIHAQYLEIENHSTRHSRDYMILRDTHKYLDHVHYHFSLILSSSLSVQPTTTVPPSSSSSS